MSDQSPSSYVVSGLIKKKAELLGKIDFHKNEARKLSEVISHLDASIKAFDPEFKIDSIEAKVFRKKNTIFEHGELSRLILNVLREATEPMTTIQITDEIKERKKIKESIAGNVANTLQLQAKNGRIQKQNKGKIVLWFVA